MMANARIYWYPAGSAALETISFGHGVSTLTEVPMRDVADARPQWGGVLRHDRGGYRRLHITAQGLTAGSALVRHLRSLVTHLQSGGRIGFCTDASKVWGSWATVQPTQGDASILVDGSRFTTWEGAGALVSGDEITVESPNPELVREYLALSGSVATLATSVAVSSDVRYSPMLTPVFVRYADFYPALYLPDDMVGADLMPQEVRRSWTWDVELIEDPADIAALYESAQGMASGSAAWDTGSLQYTLDSAIKAGKAKAADWTFGHDAGTAPAPQGRPVYGSN